jgi:ribonuclease P protein component
MAPDHQAPAPLRLKRRAEFLKVAAKGRKAAVPGLVLQALPRDDEAPARLGFTVTRKVGNAVVRNRTRRRLREAARLLLREQPVAGVDLVLIGREGTRSRPFRQLLADLSRALDKAGVKAGAKTGTPRAASPAGGPDKAP